MSARQRAEADYKLIEEAAVAGERCPQTNPHGPLGSASIVLLYEAGRIKSEVYRHNWRVVTILTGEHAGASTKLPPTDGGPYMINGMHVDLINARRRGKIAP